VHCAHLHFKAHSHANRALRVESPPSRRCTVYVIASQRVYNIEKIRENPVFENICESVFLQDRVGRLTRMLTCGFWPEPVKPLAKRPGGLTYVRRRYRGWRDRMTDDVAYPLFRRGSAGNPPPPHPGGGEGGAWLQQAPAFPLLKGQ
jgi:hypothetical protein